MISRTFLPTIGGIETLVNDIATGLVELKYNLTVVTPNTYSKETEIMKGFHVQRFFEVPFLYKNAHICPSLIWKLPKKSDIVHIFSCLPSFVNLYSLFHYKIRNRPLVFTTIWPLQLTHLSTYGFKKKMMFVYDSCFLKSILQPCDAIVCLTQTEAKAYSDLLGNDKFVTSIPECIDFPVNCQAGEQEKVRQKLAIARTDKILLSVGRIHPRKRLDLAIKAFRLISDYDKDCKLFIVGPCQDYAYACRLQALVSNLALNKKVVFTGKITMEERDCLYQLASMVVHTSEFEAFCRPALEAWRFKTPIIAFNLGPATDFIEKDKGGLTTKCWGDVEELSQLAVQVLQDEKRSSLGLNGLKRSKANMPVKWLQKSTRKCTSTFFIKIKEAWLVARENSGQFALHNSQTLIYR